MIYSVHGTLLAKELSLAVVECGGVGYACRTTFTTLSQLGNVGETVFYIPHSQCGRMRWSCSALPQNRSYSAFAC